MTTLYYQSTGDYACTVRPEVARLALERNPGRFVTIEPDVEDCEGLAHMGVDISSAYGGTD